jgi:hypothetical protein
VCRTLLRGRQYAYIDTEIWFGRRLLRVRLCVGIARAQWALRRFVESSTSRLVYQTKTRPLSYDIEHADDAL